MHDVEHWSDCAVHNAPALPAGPCDCGGYEPDYDGFAVDPRESEAPTPEDHP